MSLKDSLVWVELVSPKRNRRLEFPDTLRRYTGVVLPSGDFSVRVRPRLRLKNSYLPTERLLRFVTLVRKALDTPGLVERYYRINAAGKRAGQRVRSTTPWAWAAHRMHGRLRDFMPDEATKEIVEGLVARWSLDPTQRAAMVRAAENKLLIENMDKGDKDSQRLVVDVIKSISKDVQVGKEGKTGGQLGAEFGEGLRSVLQGIELPKEIAASEESQVIDAEFTDETK